MNADWTELVFTVSAGDARTAEGLLSGCSGAGLYVEDYSDMETLLPLVGAADYIDESLVSKCRDRAIIHIYLSSTENVRDTEQKAKELLERAGISYELQSAALADSDWENDWKKQHVSHRVGRHLLLCPSWETPAPEPGDVVLVIDPRGAFGSGEDVTTTLCLQMLERHIGGGERVLDMGCGSGVLGIAALLLGAKSARGADIEERVLKEVPENARQNGVDSLLSVMCGNVLTDVSFCEKVGEGFDLICGNIVADVQLLMAPLYFSKLRPDGVLVLSGVLDSRADEVKNAMERAGLRLLDSLAEGEWRAFAYKK